ncbi:hypothetical protein AMATHDRAFT_139666 [Amanita thiersii Skay4041]|uniref:Ubiquitin-like domain-containing protein n=1 Tax=Amanita thiersii Skay4041 TaxID=703135 RepID=A0A2A9NXI1_9AGAR|nr:hypothetical protein AMATHDRAFT_139666 [Amanita thiersii Skay4041]
MSLVELRVELPAYSHSFNVNVQHDSTILIVKQEISQVCPGNPRIEGQRLIWRGRYLNDDECVSDLWKSQNEPRIIHLVVHPSGWTSAPPSLTSSRPSISTKHDNTSESILASPRMPLRAPSFRYQPPTQTIQTVFDRLNGPPPVESSPMDYIQWKHDSAICALLYGYQLPWCGAGSLQICRAWAQSHIQSHGYEWPAVLDEDFPPATEGGVRYEQTLIDGFPFLSLADFNGTPTPFQSHAIKTLSCTFSILSLDLSATRPVPPASSSVPGNNAPDVNVLLQQLGLPPLRLQDQMARGNNQNRVMPEIRDLPLRPLLAPLLFLIFRTCLLLYFVAPARKPVFGMLILAWMLYEIWQPIRNAFDRNQQRADADDQRRQNNPPGNNANINDAVNGEPRQQQQPQQPHRAQERGAAGARQLNGRAMNGGSLLDALAGINLNAEQQVIRMTPGTTVEEPSLGRKITTFLTLLVTTTHPAVWNRRRVALRRREGQLRTEANMRDDNEGESERREEGDGEGRRRPEWVRRYIERVVAREWGEESD